MPNPAAAIEEAIGAHLDGWKAADGKELYAFLVAFPDVLDKLKEAVIAAINDADPSGDLEGVLGDQLDTFSSSMDGAYEAMNEAKEAYHNHYAFFLNSGD
jgi:hypothetical protein